MFAQLRSILNFLIPATCLAASVYIFLNLILLYWFIVDPQSYWDICSFTFVMAFVMSIILPTFGIYLASLSKLGEDSIFYGIPIGVFLFSYVLINIPPTIFFPNSAREMFESLDKIEEYIDEAIPTQAIEEATKNRTATEVLLFRIILGYFPKYCSKYRDVLLLPVAIIPSISFSFVNTISTRRFTVSSK